jgi:hypothetical protein
MATGRTRAGLSVVVNTVIFLLAAGLGVFPSAGLLPPGPGEMALGPVILVSALGAFGGVGVYALLRNRVRQPMRVFVGRAGALFCCAFCLP